MFRALAVTFRSLVTRTPSALEEAVLDAFSWTEFLPVKDRRAFLEEFSRTLIASADMDTYERLVQVVREWRATAEVHAQPALAKRLRRSVAVVDGGAVRVPVKV